MRFFAYEDELGAYALTDEEILTTHYKEWRNKVLSKKGMESYTPEDCIQDFCIVNWAWEISAEEFNKIRHSTYEVL